MSLGFTVFRQIFLIAVCLLASTLCVTEAQAQSTYTFGNIEIQLPNDWEVLEKEGRVFAKKNEGQEFSFLALDSTQDQRHKNREEQVTALDRYVDWVFDQRESSRKEKVDLVPHSMTTLPNGSVYMEWAYYPSKSTKHSVGYFAIRRETNMLLIIAIFQTSPSPADLAELRKALQSANIE